MRGDRVCFAATVFYFLILLERRKAVCRRGETCEEYGTSTIKASP